MQMKLLTAGREVPLLHTVICQGLYLSYIINKYEYVFFLQQNRMSAGPSRPPTPTKYNEKSYVVGAFGCTKRVIRQLYIYIKILLRKKLRAD
jgi:hypothetical protein